MRPEFDPLVGKIHWSRKWQPTSVFLPGKLHEQRTPVGYSPWSSKELDMTEHTIYPLKRNPVLFPGGLDGKVSAYNEGDPDSIPGSGRAPGEGNDNPPQYSCLENPMDRGAC